MDRLFISEENISKAKEQTGEQLGGHYVARVQTGVEKDGSPQYRYFRSQADYNKYLAQQREAKKKGKNLGQGSKVKTGEKGKSKKKDAKERLKAKLKEEQEESTTKTRGAGSRKRSKAAAKRQSLFSGGKGKMAASLNKGIPLYLGADNE